MEPQRQLDLADLVHAQLQGAETPPALGRYVALGELGRGGLGVVYHGYDPALDRDVAIKVVETVDEADPRRSRERLRREAAALARLSHPNIVNVYDVFVPSKDSPEGGVFVVMEHVEGRTVRQWLASGPRRWDEILETFNSAGRGLAAAHTAGVLHRDFKPSNVMVGDDGRVRVLDFGLAAIVDAYESIEAPDVVEMADRPTRPEPLTRPGERMGTQGYMAPEQLYSGYLDERTDQYSFCIGLYEALYGHRPLRELTVKERIRSLRAKRLPHRRGLPLVPVWLDPIICRGLAIESSERWHSMDDLLAAIEQGQGRRWVPAAIGVGLLAVSASLLLQHADRCPDREDELARAWTQVRQTEIATAFSQSAPYGSHVWNRVGPRVDDYARDWREAFMATCRAQRDDAEARSVTEPRRACLDDALVQLRLTTDVLATSDERVVLRAYDLLDALPRLARCAEARGETTDARVPPGLDPGALARIREAVVNARTLHLAGRPDEAAALLDELDRDADPAAVDVLANEIQLVRGLIFTDQYREQEAQAVLRSVLGRAQRQGERTTALAAATHLIEIADGGDGQPDAWPSYVEIAHELLEQHGYRDRALHQARIRHAVGLRLARQGDHDGAASELTAALDLYSRTHGADRPQLAVLRGELARALIAKGLASDARTQRIAANAGLDVAFGASRPDIDALQR